MNVIQCLQVVPGETALAFYTAKNPTNVPVIGVSTYNVVPFEAGQYFNKIQCFCFEAQMLNPHEEVSKTMCSYGDIEKKRHIYRMFSRLTCPYSFTSIQNSMRIQKWNLLTQLCYRIHFLNQKMVSAYQCLAMFDHISLF